MGRHLLSPPRLPLLVPEPPRPEPPRPAVPAGWEAAPLPLAGPGRVFRGIVGVHRCGLCGRTSAPGTPEEPLPPLPEGWRRVRRGFAGLRTECAECRAERPPATPPRPRPLRRRWAEFPWDGDRVAHAYALDRHGECVSGDWVSLCGRRRHWATPGSPFHAELRATPRTSPAADDPYGCCQSCWARSFPGTRTVRGKLRRRRR